MPGVQITSEVGRFPLTNGLADWERVIGSTGVSRLPAELSEEAVARVDRQVATWVAENRIGGLELEAVYAVADKPPLDTGGEGSGGQTGGEAAG